MVVVFVINLGIVCFMIYEMINKFVFSIDLVDIFILFFYGDGGGGYVMGW